MSAAVSEIVHKGLNVPTVPGLELHLGGEDESALILERAVAIGEVQILPGYGFLLPLSAEAAHRLDHRLHLSIISAGVHGDGTAHRTRNAMGKLQSAQSLVHGKAG